MNALRHYPISPDLGLTPIKRFMSKNVVFATSESTIERAIQMMLSHKISGLAIVDAQNRALGVYSEWDAMIQGASHPLTDKIQYSSPPVVVHEDTLFRDVIVSFIKTKVKRLLVVDNHNVVLGLISRSDIMRAIFKDFEKEKSDG
jgi:CBS domain-containing protein